MTDLTSRYVRHVAMLTKFLIGLYLLSAVNGKSALPQTTSESTIVEKIIKERCKFTSAGGSPLTFPPANLQIPDKCSKMSLSSQQVPDDLSKNIDYFLCVALLDSTERLCHITKGNLEFGERVSIALNDALQSMMTVSDYGDDTFCKEMNVIDPDAKYPPAKLVYDRIKQKQGFCAAICVGMGDKETAQREPICKSIQFAHQQIHAAIELQTKFNNQGGSMKDREENLVDTKGAKTHGRNLKLPVLDESQAPAVSQTSQRANAQGTPEEPHMASNTDAASNSKPSESQSSMRNQPANPVALHAVEAAQAVQPVQPVQPVQAAQGVDPDPKLPATSPSKNGNIKGTAKKALPGETNENIPVLPAETSENEKTSGNDTPRTELESPNLALKSEEHIEDLKGDGNLNRNEADEIPPQTEDNDAQDDAVNKEQFDGEDDESMNNGALEANRDAAEKPPPIEKKIPNAPSQSSQQKIPQASMMGNFEEAEDSHFFAYFMSLSGLCILSYLVYHNKRKIIAMAVEGKKSRNTGRRRPNSASYHKLDSNLEEAMSSNLASTNSYVIY